MQAVGVSLLLGDSLLHLGQTFRHSEVGSGRVLFGDSCVLLENILAGLPAKRVSEGN